MRIFTAADAKNRFGELLDTARREPVRIEKHGRGVAVMISQEDYDSLEQMKLDALRAKIAQGEADIAAGRVVDGEALFAELQDMIERGDA